LPFPLGPGAMAKAAFTPSRSMELPPLLLCLLLLVQFYCFVLPTLSEVIFEERFEGTPFPSY